MGTSLARAVPALRDPAMTMQSEMSATTIPASTSSQKWLAVARTQNQTQAGQSAQTAFDHQCRRGAEEEDADDQRVRGVEARHRRVRVRERAEARSEWLTPSTKP